MRHLLFLLFAASAVVACRQKNESAENHAHHSAAPVIAGADSVKKSLPKETHAMVGNAHITIRYTAPVVKGRVIWGGLVPYNEVWATGAHRATSFEIDKSFIIGNQTVPAGKYAIFTVPNEELWTFILNRNFDQHLADEYHSADDVLRVSIKPEIATTNQERLSYSIVDLSAAGAVLQISWEKIRIRVPFRIVV